jgi:hypothetical protein
MKRVTGVHFGRSCKAVGALQTHTHTACCSACVHKAGVLMLTQHDGCSSGPGLLEARTAEVASALNSLEQRSSDRQAATRCVCVCVRVCVQALGTACRLQRERLKQRWRWPQRMRAHTHPATCTCTRAHAATQASHRGLAVLAAGWVAVQGGCCCGAPGLARGGPGGRGCGCRQGPGGTRRRHQHRCARSGRDAGVARPAALLSTHSQGPAPKHTQAHARHTAPTAPVLAGLSRVSAAVSCGAAAVEARERELRAEVNAALGKMRAYARDMEVRTRACVHARVCAREHASTERVWTPLAACCPVCASAACARVRAC